MIFIYSLMRRLFSQIFRMLEKYWMYIAILVLVIVVAVLLFKLLRWAIRKWSSAKKLEKEQKELQKDLQVWNELAKATKGQEERNSFKQTVSMRLNHIRQHFNATVAMLKKAKAPHNTPWFLLLGEPRSGKSELLRKSCLTMEGAEPPESQAASQSDLYDVSGWFSGKAFVLDVSGRVFFDRWLGGSSAEWNLLLKMIRKALGRRLLSGVILTIPADALLADDEEITRRKISLLAGELGTLLEKLHLYVPCHVVITKMDMIPGFSEYFNDLSELQACKTWGWRNADEDGVFLNADFDAYWNEMQKKMRSVTMPSLRSSKMFGKFIANDESRLLLAAGTYIFPDEINKIRHNLCSYMEGIFGKSSWLGNHQLMLSGIYFTSAEDLHLRLSQDFADFLGKKIEDVPLSIPHQPLAARPYFIQHLFDEIIFPDTHNSAKTTYRKMLKIAALWLLAGVLFFLSVTLFYHAFTPLEDNQKEAFTRQEMMYNLLSPLMEKDVLLKSPIIVYDSQSQNYKVDTVSLVHNSFYPRYGLLLEIDQRTKEVIPLSWKDYFSSLLLFGDLSYNQSARNAVWDEVIYRMVLKPSSIGFHKHICSEKFKQEKYSIALHNIFCELNYMKKQMGKKKIIQFISLKNTLLYLIPDLTEAHWALIGQKIYYNPNNMYIYQDAMNLAHDAGIKSRAIIFEKILSQWEDFTIYPESDFIRFSNVGNAVREFNKNDSAFRQLAEEFHGKLLSCDELKKLRTTLQYQLKLYDEMHLYFNDFYTNTNQFAEKAQFQKPLSKTLAMLKLEKDIKKWTHEFEKLYLEDQDTVLNSVDWVARHTAQESKKGQNRQEKAVAQILKKRIRDVFHGVKEKIAAKKVQIDMIPDELTKSQLLERIKMENEDIVVMRYAMFQELTECINSLMECTFPLDISFENLSVVQPKVIDSMQKLEAKMKRLVAKYEKDEAVKPITDSYMKLFNGVLESVKLAAITNFLDQYPDDLTEIMDLVRKFSKNRDSNTVLGLRPELTSLYFNKLTTNLSYDPEGASDLAYPLVRILSLHGKKLQQGKKVAEHIRIMNEYYRLYMQYWTKYVDEFPVSPENWQDFMKKSATYNAYQINTLLLNGYQKCREILNEVPDILLDDLNKKRKKDYINQLDTRLQVLSPNYSNLCSATIDNWKTLPDTIDGVLDHFMKMPAEQIKQRYFVLLNYDEKTGIPWWRNYLFCGLKTLNLAIQLDFISQYQKLSILLYRFPLCRDSYSSQMLMPSEMNSLKNYLHIMNGLSSLTAQLKKTTEKAQIKGEKVPVTAAVEQQGAYEFLSPRVKSWALQQQSIIDALTGSGKTLIYTLTLPPLEEQRKLNHLMATPYPLAVLRYPYISATSSQEESGQLYTRLKTEIDLFSSPVADPELTLQFFRQMEDAKPPLLNYTGAWCMLKIYLARNSYYDFSKKILYAPLLITGAKGDRSVLWLGCKFNKPLPRPDEWPTSGLIPSFSEMQELVQGSSLKSDQLDATLLNGGVGEKGYRELFQKVCRHDGCEKWFVRMVVPADVKQQINVAPLLTMPYLRVWIDGRKHDFNLRSKHPARLDLNLNDSRVRFELRRFRSDKEPGMIYRSDALYPVLRLFCLAGKKTEPGKVVVEVPFTSPENKRTMKLAVELIPEPKKETDNNQAIQQGKEKDK